MGDFYFASVRTLIFCIMMAAGTIIVQTMNLVCGFHRLCQKSFPDMENLLEAAVLFQLVVMALLLAEVSYYNFLGFVRPGGHQVLRYGLFAALAVLGGMISWKKHLFWPMLVPVMTALTLPINEKIGGKFFPFMFMLTLGFWMVRCSHRLWARKKEQQSRLSGLSVKEAIDTMDTGLLFCQAQEKADGQIILQNRKMQELMYLLMGEYQCNGKMFYEALISGKVMENCQKSELGEQLTYRLPDQTVWTFELYLINRKGQKLALLTASDTTQRWKAAQQLWQKNRELEQRHQELNTLLENLENICKTEETIHAKSRVHDVLGQRISLLLRALREHRQPDEVLLRSFAQGLPKELTELSADTSYSLDTLVKAFQGLGVTIQVEGSLPPKEDVARSFAEIAAEAVTNAVRHGYASEVKITIENRQHRWTMDITDSGIPPAQISEGGGLTGMRRKAQRLGGKFSYEISPHFTIHLSIPE